MDRIDYDKVKSILGYHGLDIAKCIENINYNSTFPEDMCEDRMDWEDLKEQLLLAQETVVDLIGVIEKLS